MRFDATGLAWILDEENGIAWRNGGTGSFNSYIGLDPVRGIAVVVLADTGPGFRIPACVMGARLLRDLRIFRAPPLKSPPRSPRLLGEDGWPTVRPRGAANGTLR